MPLRRFLKWREKSVLSFLFDSVVQEVNFLKVVRFLLIIAQ